MNVQDTSAEPTPDLQLEIAHILLIDVVGYSKLLVNEQIELLEELKQIVRSTECFRAAEARGELIRVPTGDGMALIFFHSPEDRNGVHRPLLQRHRKPDLSRLMQGGRGASIEYLLPLIRRVRRMRLGRMPGCGSRGRFGSSCRR